MNDNNSALSASEFKEKYGPWAVIGGASDGTGEAFARAVAARGIHCVLIARRDAVLKSLADSLQREFNVETKVIVADLSTDDAAEKIIKETQDIATGLFIANAGVTESGKTFLDTSIPEIRELITLNIHTPLALAHHYAAEMVGRRKGGILLMGSGGALGGQPYLATLYLIHISEPTRR